MGAYEVSGEKRALNELFWRTGADGVVVLFQLVSIEEDDGSDGGTGTCSVIGEVDDADVHDFEEACEELGLDWSET